MATGTLIAESIRSGATLSGPPLSVREIERVAPTNLSPEQRQAGIPSQWTLLRFELADRDAQRLCDALAEVLAPLGWYVDFHTDDETFVVFSGRCSAMRRATVLDVRRPRNMPASTAFPSRRSTGRSARGLLLETHAARVDFVSAQPQRESNGTRDAAGAFGDQRERESWPTRVEH